MKFVQTGEYKSNALELPVEIQPIERAQKESLKRLDYLLVFIKDLKPDILEEYVSNLSAKYQKLLKEDIITEKAIDLEKIISKMDFLKNYLELAKNSFNYYLQLLQLPEDSDWLNNKVEVLNESFLRSFLHPRYYNLLVLTETIGREEAIKLYKRYITHYFIDNQTSQEDDFEGLEALFERRIQPDPNPSEWVIFHGIIADGKYAYKNMNCTWVDVLKDLPDPELKYYGCCYGDYQRAKAHDENIILTMEHTIAQGDPYCSRVLHDTRIDWDLRHPPKEFWDKMSPEN